MINHGTSKDIAFILFSNIGNDNLASAKERKLVKRINSLDSTETVSISSLNTLKSAFSAAASDDPYSLSPTYYALTGRRGLWLYKEQDEEDNKTAFLFCLHPNLQETIMVFPPFGHAPIKAIKNLFDALSDMDINFQIGRIAKDSFVSPQDNPKHSYKATETAERVLDWTYPVHTIDCHALLGHKGKEYSRIRQTINKFSNTTAMTRDINFKTDFPVIDSLAKAWEKNTHHYDNYDVTFTKYFQHLVELANSEPSLGLKGLIISIDGQDKGFSIWEPPLNQGKTANLFASQVSDFEITNLATYLTIESARKMVEGGAHYMCLGGSENEGMDRYKRGFIPARSTELATIEMEANDHTTLIV